MNTAVKFCLVFLCVLYSSSSSAQESVSGLDIFHIRGNIYAYTTYKIYEGSKFPSNSMYMVTDQGIVMFDTPWDSTRLQPLIDSFYARHGKKPILSVSTHFHADRTEGLDLLRKAGVKTYSSQQTKNLCIRRGEEVPEFSFLSDTALHFGNQTVEIFYPGEGHTSDNIVIWFPQEKVLYGGCLIKSTEATDLGNIADANLSEWKESIKKLMKRFPLAEVVIPGHQGWENSRSLQHTLYLLEKSGIN